MPRLGLPLVLLLGASVRSFLLALPAVHSTLVSRPELATAVSSFRRLQEGAHLFRSTGSPYSGDVYHQPPLLFALLYPVLQLPPAALQYLAACVVFVSVDLLIAAGLARLCAKNLQLEEGRRLKAQGREIWLSQVPVSPLLKPENLPITVAFIALMNPLVFASEGALAASMMCVAAGTYLSVYPFFLMVPIVLLLRSVKSGKTEDDDGHVSQAGPSLVSLGVTCLLVFGIWLGLLFYLSLSLSGDWSFLEETYVWVAKYSDLTPNIGIFWYFFMEVFDRFIPYFLFIMHLHPVIYVVPIYLRLAHRPQAYACTLIGIFSLFQAYPSFGDFGFFLSMLALHPKTIMTIENRFVYVLGLGVATCMLPVMWFLWLFPASGNANFFYNQTLVYQIFNSQVITAFVGATMKRDKDVAKFRAASKKLLVD
ncbi:gpi transamidase subunit pig-u family protein [Phytophthora cinnamomi]|uniref:gpi transamidase subunit pig-u family protein n=1 Tax=Phytophthora cinnamomi TaxID=4785 RepID=UPI00355A6449|nr:gpi transamidase subunit pig-u family protein [Phytophthora cinnamomi]